MICFFCNKPGKYRMSYAHPLCELCAEKVLILAKPAFIQKRLK